MCTSSFSRLPCYLAGAFAMLSAGVLPAQTDGGIAAPLAKELITVKAGTWRSEMVFTHAIWRDLLFYGGGSGSDGGDVRHEMEIGVFHLTAPDAGRQHPGNPVVTRAQFGLDGAGKGITPLSIIETDGRLFMFCTARPDGELMPRIVVIEASAEDPYTWKNMTVVVDQKFSGEKNNHGASAMVDPEDPGRLLLYFSALTPPAGYRILLASVPLDGIMDPGVYRLLNDYENPVLKREDAKTNYPFVRHEDGRYELYYSGQAIVSASGTRRRNDCAYATGPAIHAGHLYYSGRAKGKDRIAGFS